ncbi:sesquipedalian-1-like isoform X2 [Boleophthalmus pectinirostris]|uniref:sesquipedalian-1-like isoform X2 n=1 Tax=Boleophthalmus pectinirostris TaxID=150288 RepID=UPI000A1C57D9|nr:sesquipedalian-1-like isoform X2 [Boleophthalmus pectinirostris]
MKIDEKVMCYFESSNTPVDKQGYLYKKGEIKTSYQKRWFVLKGNLLFYKEKPADRDLIGVIVLEGCTVQLCESDEQFAFSLVWSEPGLRTYKFAAEDQESLEDWIKTLLSANHQYLALLLSDMEQAYRALGGPPIEPTKTNPFVMPYFPISEAGHASTSSLLRHSSSQPTIASSSSAAGPALGPCLRAGPVAGPMLQPSAAISTKPTLKKSPKLWPKKATNAVNTQPSSMFFGDFAGITLDPQDEFVKMHEEFGKEIKKLISHWAKRRPDGQEDLIDFG